MHDVLAGEQGPSCSSVKQIPNLNGEEKVGKTEGIPRKKHARRI